jgi:ribosomal protein L10
MVPVNPRMFCVGGVVDGEILGSEGVRTMGGMPGLRTLQAQVLGLVGTPAQQIAGLMGQASGGQLARVLEGLKVSLEEKEGGGEAAKSE